MLKASSRIIGKVKKVTQRTQISLEIIFLNKNEVTNKVTKICLFTIPVIQK